MTSALLGGWKLVKEANFQVAASRERLLSAQCEFSAGQSGNFAGAEISQIVMEISQPDSRSGKFRKSGNFR